jgi:hypothetical protein
MPARSLPLVRFACAVSLLGFSLAAAAQDFNAVDVLTPSSSGRYPAYATAGVPLSEFWVQGGGMVDTDVLRRSIAPPPTEEVLRLGAGGRKDTYIYGRQMLRLEGRVDDYLYNHFSELNSVNYGGNAAWHWELGNDLSGVLGVSRRSYQRDLAQIQAPVRDRLTETRYVANGGYLLGPSVRLTAGADLVDYRDAAFFRSGQLQIAEAFGGVEYVTPLGNTFGVEYRRAHGDAPVSTLFDPTGVFVDNSFEERSLSLTAGYVNPFLRLRGRLGRTQRTYNELPGFNFDGKTWRATADWLVTTKTALGFETYYEPRSVIEVGVSDVLVRGIAFGPGWAPTAKLNFTARVMRERLDYHGGSAAFTVAGVTPAQLEIVRLLRLGAYWEYTRQIHWQFAIDHGQRESNVLGRDYRYNAFVANVRYIFW